MDHFNLMVEVIQWREDRISERVGLSIKRTHVVIHNYSYNVPDIVLGLATK